MKFKFLVDECTGRRLAVLLKNAGHDVLFVGDWMPSASDDEVLQKAKEDGRILIRASNHLLNVHGFLIYSTHQKHQNQPRE